MLGIQHACPLTGHTLIWGQKKQNNNLPSPRLFTFTLWSVFQCLTTDVMWHPQISDSVLMVSVKAVELIVSHRAQYAHREAKAGTLCFMTVFLCRHPPSLLLLFLLVSLVPSSLQMSARVFLLFFFIRGLPAELQQAFPGEEATGSRRLIKPSHYWASTGPQGSLPPSSYTYSATSGPLSPAHTSDMLHILTYTYIFFFFLHTVQMIQRDLRDLWPGSKNMASLYTRPDP